MSRRPQALAQDLRQVVGFGVERRVAHGIKDVLFLGVVLLHEHEQCFGGACKLVAVLGRHGGDHLREQAAHLAVLVAHHLRRALAHAGGASKAGKRISPPRRNGFPGRCRRSRAGNADGPAALAHGFLGCHECCVAVPVVVLHQFGDDHGGGHSKVQCGAHCLAYRSPVALTAVKPLARGAAPPP